MASTDFDSPADKGAAKTPISLHPAFPAVVALWFAALLGLGSLILPLILLERTIEVTGLAAYVPAAAPPLGLTARGAIAGAAAVLGAFLGIVIARRVAKSHEPKAAGRFAASATRRPLNVHDDLDDEGIAAAPAPRRRALAMAEDERPSDFRWAAPLPGEDSGRAPVAAAEPAVEAARVEPLELSELALEAPAPDVLPPAPVHADIEPDLPMSDDPPAQFPSQDEAERRRADRRSGLAGKGPGGIERRLFLRRVEDDPLPFVAPSLARRTPDNENTASDAVAVTVNFMDAPERPYESEPEHAQPVVHEPAAESADWQSAPLADLGMMQLVQRLGASLERRRERTAAGVPAAGMPAAPVAALDEFEAAEADEAAEAMAAYFGKPAVAAEPAEPDVETDDSGSDGQDDHDRIAASFSLPLRQAPDAFEDAEDQDEDETEAEFGSLLGLANPFQAPREEFVRVEDPEPAASERQPAVVFPGAGRAAATRPFDRPATETPAEEPAFTRRPVNEDTDEALRRALATLQRMNGAA